MSRNDVLFLESNFDNWKRGRGIGLRKNIDPFVYYTVEQFLKPYDPDDEEILYGITDGPDDGGVDAIYLIANRSEFVCDDTVLEQRHVTKVRLLVVQVKSGNEGFKSTEIDKLYFFLDDLLDLGKKASSVANKYHAKLVKMMDAIKQKLLLVSGGFPNIVIDCYYIIKRDGLQPDKKAKDSVERIKTKVIQHLSDSEFNFHCVNAQAILEQVAKRPSRNRTIVWSEQPMLAREGFVGLVKLSDYYEFIRDGGDLAEHIFEANVRGFQQNTPVNTQIRKSLESKGLQNFWLLNNGITVVAERAPSAGHMRHELEDPQVVNGLQTSREIFNYFSSGVVGEDHCCPAISRTDSIG